jgi:hypothetical protein
VISPNAGTTPRSGFITIAGQAIGVGQAGTACSYALEGLIGSAPASGGTGNVRMVAPSGCGWTAVSNTSWLTIVSSGSIGTSEVQFAAAANTSAGARSGTLTIGGQTYTVNQAGAACTYTVTGASTSDQLAAEGVGGLSFGFTSAFSGCTPLPVSYSDWITQSASFAGTSGSVSYSASPNPYGLSRTGTIFVGSAAYTVVQSGSPCAYSLNAYGRVFHLGGGADTVFGSFTNTGCIPEVGTNQPSFIFLELPPTGPTLNVFSLPYLVSPFPSSLTTSVRWGTITFGGRIVAIKQFSW